MIEFTVKYLAVTNLKDVNLYCTNCEIDKTIINSPSR